MNSKFSEMFKAWMLEVGRDGILAILAKEAIINPELERDLREIKQVADESDDPSYFETAITVLAEVYFETTIFSVLYPDEPMRTSNQFLADGMQTLFEDNKDDPEFMKGADFLYEAMQASKDTETPLDFFEILSRYTATTTHNERQKVLKDIVETIEASRSQRAIKPQIL